MIFSKCSRIRSFVKMKVEQFVWRLYDKCADYLDKHSLVDRVDSDKLQDLSSRIDELEDTLYERDQTIADLEELLEYKRKIEFLK